jgi:hypothetical protein
MSHSSRIESQRAAGGGRRNKPRTFLQRDPYQLPASERLGHRTIRARCSSGILERDHPRSARALPSVAVPAGVIVTLRLAPDIRGGKNTFCSKTAGSPTSKIRSRGTVARSGGWRAALLSPVFGSGLVGSSQSVEPRFPSTTVSRAVFVGCCSLWGCRVWVKGPRRRIAVFWDSCDRWLACRWSALVQDGNAH